MIDIRPFRPDDAEAVSALVREVFDEQVAASFEPDGVAEMHEFVKPAAVADRARARLTLVARDGEQPVGVLQMRDEGHVSMLFVRTAYAGRGIATALLARAEAGCRAAGLAVLTVNASLNAQGYYARQGFVPSAEPQRLHGFSFVPMEKHLEES